MLSRQHYKLRATTMHKIILTLLLFSVMPASYGQKIEKVYLDKTDSTKNCYTIIYPPKLPWKGYLFLLGGFGETIRQMVVERGKR